MADLPPGDPKLVSLIVNHLKSQGLFDQFRRDCLADVDTKPAYQNLRQRVDNFVSNHLASHTWSPHLNKNQLRNNIRQQVLKSGMLEAGIDRIISQVVDPKINHLFRPQVEKVVQDFLATLHNKDEVNANHEQAEEKCESSVPNTGSVSTAGPTTSVANDAMSILETISSLNQEATAARALTENTNHKNIEKVSRRLAQQNLDASSDKDRGLEELQDYEKLFSEVPSEFAEQVFKQEDSNDNSPPLDDNKNVVSEAVGSTQNKDSQNDSDERPKAVEKPEKKVEVAERLEKKEDKKETRTDKRSDHSKKADEATRQKEEKFVKEKEMELESIKYIAEKSSKQKPDIMKDECPSIDSDLDALSDMTVSSVHTSDLSSFEEESEVEDSAASESTEEGEITSDEEEKKDAQNKTKPASEQNEPKAKGTRHSYVHKPYLYSKYYSDSDDELTVEQRRQSVAKEKEERLLSRRLKRERLEEKRKQKAAERVKALKMKNQGTSSSLPKPSKDEKTKSARKKEVLKEQLFLEKKVALSKKKRKDDGSSSAKLKTDILDEDSREAQKSTEEKISTSTKEMKLNTGKSDVKSTKKTEQIEEGKCDSRPEKEIKKKVSSFVERAQDTETQDTRKPFDSNSEEHQKPKSSNKPEKPLRKENESEMQNVKITQRKESKYHRNDRERTYSEEHLSSRQEERSSSKPEERSSYKQEERVSLKLEERLSSKQEERLVLKQDERSSLKHKSKTENGHKQGSDESDSQKSRRTSKVDSHSHKYSKSSSEERSDRKSKQKSDGKSSSIKDERPAEHCSKKDENARHDGNKKDKSQFTEKLKSEHRYKPAGDFRDHKDSQSSSRPHSSQKKSRSFSDDKNEAESVSSDHSRSEENVHKDKKRLNSSSDERLQAKEKSKGSNNKLSKPTDQADAAQKNEKFKVAGEIYTDKYRKSKSEDRDGERKDSINSTSSAKETSYKPKHSSDKSKETSRIDKAHTSFKVDKKLSGENSKSSNTKHSHKDPKRKDDGKRSEERITKNPNERTIQERSSSSDRKLIKKNSSEQRSGISRDSSTKKGLKSESESDCASVSSGSGESKESRENKKPGKILMEDKEKACAEVKMADCQRLANSDNLPYPAEATASKKTLIKFKSKHENGESKDSKSSSSFKIISPSLSGQKVSATRDSNTLTSDYTNENKRTAHSSKDGTDVPDESDSGFHKKARSYDERNDVLPRPSRHLGTEELNKFAPAPQIVDRSSLSLNELSSEVTNSLDDEISTSDVVEDAKCVKETDNKSDHIVVPVEVLEFDSVVTGNEVEGDSSALATQVSVTESNQRNLASDNISGNQEGQSSSRNITSMDINIGSSISTQKEEFLRFVSGGHDQSRKVSQHEAAATSSSFVTENNLIAGGEDTASSSSAPVENNTDISFIETETVKLDNSREYTSSASADGNCVEDDGDITMLSENSFEDATTSSSTDSKPYNEDGFMEPLLSLEKNRESTATCSQSTADVALEKVGIVTLKAATSSSATRGPSENTHEDAASSSDNTEAQNLELELLSNVNETATSSDVSTESTASEMVNQVATSSQSDAILDLSENATAQSATSSSSSGVHFGAVVSEGQTATSSSSMINSRRVMNFGFSSEVDNENLAASSSSVMDGCMGDDSSEWLKDAPEREREDAASSSSSLSRTCRSQPSFVNVEDSKNTRATSSTQQESANEVGTDVISSGTFKEYPGNSSDLAMDSSTEVSISVSSEFYSESNMGCSSSREDQSLANDKYTEPTKEKDNAASSSNGGSIALIQTVGGNEATSSSSSFTNSDPQHRLNRTPGHSDNKEATASSSISTNNSDQYCRTSPGNSSDATATSSSSSVNIGTFTDVHQSTHPTASSSVAMDSSTGEDLNMSFSGLGSRPNTATSSDVVDNLFLGDISKDRGPTSSSMMADGIKETGESLVYANKVSEQAATSSDMMDSSLEDDKACDALSNNNPCATTSTGTNVELGANMDDVSDVNSEATAASSSNAPRSSLHSGENNATSSDYTMNNNMQEVVQASDLLNMEAATSSSLFDIGIQQINTEVPEDELVVDDATSSSSTERGIELVSGINENQNHESSCGPIEMAAESSFVANHSNTASFAASQESVVPPSQEVINDARQVEINVVDGVNVDYENLEEKEDTVSSASSEEQKLCIVSRQAARQLGEGETDSVVTSAGTVATEATVSRENSEASAHVICADTDLNINASSVMVHFSEEEGAVSHTVDQNQSEDQVSEASVENIAAEEPEGDVLDENADCDIAADICNENARANNQLVTEEGEGAVTSTGITEESYGEKALLGQDDGACSGTESDENDSLNIPGAVDPRAVAEDDESAITSTGAKEDEEEGEGFVTSSGTPGEESSFSNAVEDHSVNLMHTAQNHSDCIVVNTENKTVDPEVGVLNSEIIQCVTRFATPKLSQNFMPHVTKYENTLDPSEEIVHLAPSADIGSPNQASANLESENHNESQAEVHLSATKEPQGCLSESNDVFENPHLDNKAHSEMVSQFSDVERIAQSDFNQDISTPSKENLDHDKAQIDSKDVTNIAPAVVEDVVPELEIPNADNVGHPESLTHYEESLEGSSRSLGCIFMQVKETRTTLDILSKDDTSTSDLDKGIVSHSENALQEKAHDSEGKEKAEEQGPSNSEKLVEHKEPNKEVTEENKDKKRDEKVEVSQSAKKPEEKPSQPKVEPEKRKRGRPPKKRPLSTNTDADASSKEKNDVEHKNAEVLESPGPGTVKRRGRKKRCLENEEEQKGSSDMKSSPRKERQAENKEDSSSKAKDTEMKNSEVIETESPGSVKRRGRRKRCSQSFSENEDVKKDRSETENPVNKKGKTEDKIVKEDYHKEKNDTEIKNSDLKSESSGTVKRRGRKKLCSQSLSENEGSEPEKKRKRTESSEDNKEESEDEEEESDGEEGTPRGATTRAASRLEAQRKLPHKPTTRAAAKLNSPEPHSLADRRRKMKSPESKAGKVAKRSTSQQTPQASGTKRRREASPPTPRTRGQHGPEETVAKKLKR